MEISLFLRICPRIADVQARTITEVKRRPDGREERYECEVVSLTDDVAVVRFVTPYVIGPVPKGTVTLGFFWARRPYNLFRFLSPEDELLGHRMDVVTDVRLEEDRVEYLDLYVDVMVSPTGDLHVEDEDEAKEAAEKGLLRPKDVQAIEDALTTIMRDHRRIIRDALSMLPDE